MMRRNGIVDNIVAILIDLQRIDFEYVDRKLNEERVKVDAFIRKYC